MRCRAPSKPSCIAACPTPAESTSWAAAGPSVAWRRDGGGSTPRREQSTPAGSARSTPRRSGYPLPPAKRRAARHPPSRRPLPPPAADTAPRLRARQSTSGGVIADKSGASARASAVPAPTRRHTARSQKPHQGDKVPKAQGNIEPGQHRLLHAKGILPFNGEIVSRPYRETGLKQGDPVPIPFPKLIS